MIAKCNRAESTILFENMIVLGGIFGTIMSVFTDISLPVGHWLLYVYGFCAGIFVGCIAVALAEILNTFPIIFRRFQIKEGLSWIMLFMAFGKLAMHYALCKNFHIKYNIIDPANSPDAERTVWRKHFHRHLSEGQHRDIVIWSAWYLTKT